MIQLDFQYVHRGIEDGASHSAARTGESGHFSVFWGRGQSPELVSLLRA